MLGVIQLDEGRSCSVTLSHTPLTRYLYLLLSFSVSIFVSLFLSLFSFLCFICIDTLYVVLSFCVLLSLSRFLSPSSLPSLFLCLCSSPGLASPGSCPRDVIYSKRMSPSRFSARRALKKRSAGEIMSSYNVPKSSAHNRQRHAPPFQKSDDI